MVWDGRSKPLVVPTRWALIRVALGGAPVWPCSGGEGFTEESAKRRPPCYLPLEQMNVNIQKEIPTTSYPQWISSQIYNI